MHETISEWWKNSCGPMASQCYFVRVESPLWQVTYHDMNLCKMPLYHRHLRKWEFCLQPSNTWITFNYLKQFKQFNFAQGSHFRINDIAKITFWAIYFLSQDFRPCIFQPTLMLSWSSLTPCSTFVLHLLALSPWRCLLCFMEH